MLRCSKVAYRTPAGGRPSWRCEPSRAHARRGFGGLRVPTAASRVDAGFSHLRGRPDGPVDESAGDALTAAEATLADACSDAEQSRSAGRTDCVSVHGAAAELRCS